MSLLLEQRRRSCLSNVPHFSGLKSRSEPQLDLVLAKTKPQNLLLALDMFPLNLDYHAARLFSLLGFENQRRQRGQVQFNRSKPAMMRDR